MTLIRSLTRSVDIQSQELHPPCGQFSVPDKSGYRTCGFRSIHLSDKRIKWIRIFRVMMCRFAFLRQRVGRPEKEKCVRNALEKR